MAADEERKKGSRKKGGIPLALRILSPISNLAAMERGGKVQKTGERLVHKNERVIPASKRESVERLMKKNHIKMRGSKKRGKTRGVKRGRE